jgi:hypothetical protein
VQTKVRIEGGFTDWPIKPKKDNTTGEFILSTSQWNDILGWLIFGLKIAADRNSSAIWIYSRPASMIGTVPHAPMAHPMTHENGRSNTLALPSHRVEATNFCHELSQIKFVLIRGLFSKQNNYFL